MSDQASAPFEDPWAWLHANPAEPETDWSDQRVIAVVVAHNAADWIKRTLTALDESEVIVHRIVVADAGSTDATLEILKAAETAGDIDQVISLPAGRSFGESVNAAVAGQPRSDWLWLLHDDCMVEPNALRILLDRADDPQRPADLVAPLLAERRRGTGPFVEGCGETLSGGGRLVELAEPGEIHQGQLDAAPVLGASAAGLLVRRSAWENLGGFADGLESSHQGLELGWLANLAGRTVVAEPDARVLHLAVGQRGLRGDRERRLAGGKRSGLQLQSAHAPARRIPLVLAAFAAALGFLLGKDPARARAELAGLSGWLRDRATARTLRDRVKAVGATREAKEATARLRPSRGFLARQRLDAVGGRIADWSATFTDRSQPTSLDDLTGDDFADQGRPAARTSPVAFGGGLLALVALVAARHLFGPGQLSASQLLPIQPRLGELFADYLGAIPGQPNLAGPPWQGLAGIGSTLTIGQPEWLVTLLLLGCVPLTWLAAFRLLRQLVDDAWIAVIGALLYALAPALLGVLNRGQLGLAAFTLLLPLLGYTVWWWSTSQFTHWRGAGAVALLLLMLTALVPATWAIALVVAVVLGIRGRSGRLWAELALVVLSPGLLLASPWGRALLANPGRALTGPEPTMAPLEAPNPWLMLLGQTPGDGMPPLWVAAVVLGGAWLMALAAVLRKPGPAQAALLAASGAYLVGVGLTRLVVTVPPGVGVRPDGVPWLILMAAGLGVTVTLGMDGVLGDLRRTSLGLAHALTLGLAVIVAVATVVGAGWWALAGESGLHRGPVGSLPAFVRNSQLSATPTRTLAVETSAGQVRWALLQDDLTRLGDTERGAVLGGDPAALALADSVVKRLLDGSVDEQIVPDLATLGVGHVWVRGSDADLRMLISNVPGLGAGSGDETGAVWPVPGSGRYLLEDGTERVVVGPGALLPAGSAQRRLVLAEPADARWNATLDGRPLRPVDVPGGHQGFEVDAAGGVLQVGLTGGTPWWAWLQLAGFVLLVIMAAPGLRRPEPAAATPRRTLAPESSGTDAQAAPAGRRFAEDDR